MKKIVRSARGVTVDFDLLRIKDQIASAPKTTDVKARENFIDQKFKRRIRRLTQDTPPASPPPTPSSDNGDASE